MQAYEFYATPENRVIRIPEQYKDKITSGVKVILLEEQQGKTKARAQAKKRSDLLLPPSYDTTGWKFDREEADER